MPKGSSTIIRTSLQVDIWRLKGRPIVYNEEYEHHPIKIALKNVKESIQSVNSQINDNPTILQRVADISAIVDFVELRLQQTIPLFMITSTINDISNQLDALATRLNELATDQTDSRVERCMSHANSIVGYLPNLILVTPDIVQASLQPSLEMYSQSITKIGDFAKQRHQELSAIGEQFEAQIEQLRQVVVTEKAKLATLYTENASSFSQSQEFRSSTFADWRLQKDSEINSLLEKRNEEANKLISDTRSLFEKTHVDALSSIEAIKAEATVKANGLLEDLESKKKTAEKLLGIIGNIGVSSGFAKTAIRAWRTMLFWQFLTVASMLAVVIIACMTLDKYSKPAGEQGTNGAGWEYLAVRLFISLGLGVIAAYSAFQADKNFEIERRNKKKALEFEALGPYLAPLPEAEQNKFRLQLAALCFGKDEPSLKNMAKSPTSVKDMIPPELIPEIIKALVAKDAKK